MGNPCEVTDEVLIRMDQWVMSIEQSFKEKFKQNIYSTLFSGKGLKFQPIRSEKALFFIMIGWNLRPFPENTVLYTEHDFMWLIKSI